MDPDQTAPVVHSVCLLGFKYFSGRQKHTGKGLTSWHSFVVSNCEFVHFPLVSWVRCGT